MRSLRFTAGAGRFAPAVRVDPPAVAGVTVALEGEPLPEGAAGGPLVIVSPHPRPAGGVWLVLEEGWDGTGGILASLARPEPWTCGGMLHAIRLGLLAHMFVHGLNNALFTVTGNLDLASMYGWTGEASARKGEDARAALDAMRDRIADLGLLADPLPGGAGTVPDPVGTLARSAAGRSVSVALDPPPWDAPSTDVLLTVLAALLLDVCGMGSISLGHHGLGCAEFEWSPQSSSGPGREQVSLLLAAAAVGCLDKGLSMTVTGSRGIVTVSGGCCDGR